MLNNSLDPLPVDPSWLVFSEAWHSLFQPDQSVPRINPNIVATLFGGFFLPVWVTRVSLSFCSGCFQSSKCVCQRQPAHPPNQHDNAGLQDWRPSGGGPRRREEQTRADTGEAFSLEDRRNKAFICKGVLLFFFVGGCIIYNSVALRGDQVVSSFKARQADSNCWGFFLLFNVVLLSDS